MIGAGHRDARFQKGAVIRGKYRVERVLGEGGMGVVLLATHLKLEQRVAIKVLSPAIQKRPHLQARFAREARAASMLRNEHVVRVLDVDETADGLPFLVMELLVGMDLEALLHRDGPLPAHRAADYVLQACEGIAEAHASGIVHRDLKPANLFLTELEDGTKVVKVLDFGIAKAVESEADLALTEANGVVGSPLYMSPEQLKGSRDLDARTDIWSLGVVLYQLATGKLPFEATSATALAACIASEPPISVESVRPDLPATYVRAVERCLRKDPSERFATVVDLARAIAELAPASVGSGERVARVARDAAMRVARDVASRQLSLAVTQPREEGAIASSSAGLDGRVTADHAGRPSGDASRVTAALSADEPSAASAGGQRTDYGSEVARTPSLPAPGGGRRGAPATRVFVALGTLAVLGFGGLVWMRSDAASTSRAALGVTAGRPSLAETFEAAAPLALSVARSESPSPPIAIATTSDAGFATRAAGPPVRGPQAAKPPAGPGSGAVRPLATGSPLDIELK